MAGTYADLPGQRFSLGDDGTLGVQWNPTNNIQSAVSSGSLAGAVELDSAPTAFPSLAVAQYNQGYLGLIFPELRSIRGLFIGVSLSSTSQWDQALAEYSADSLDGLSGTWTSFSASGIRHSAAGTIQHTSYRNTIAAVNIDNVKAVRFRVREANGSFRSVDWRNIHIYGYRSVSVERLAFWHPTLDQELTGAYFDFGDVARGVTTGGKQFRIKNLSATKTATGLKVLARGLNGSDLGTPGLQVSNDNTLWGIETASSTLNPSTISPIMYCRMALSDVNLVVPQARSGRLTTQIGAYA